MVDTDESTDTAELRPAPFKFSGKAGEYFGIWIVNIALSVVTLGIYSAWATVRTRRYLYGNLALDGHSFDYHAKPFAILIGRIIAAVILIAYFGLSAVAPIAQAIMSIGFLFLIPELINRSLRFNMRMTSYRNVRFGFDGSYGGALMAFVGMPILGVLTLGICYPWAIKKARTYIVTNSRYGQRNFNADISLGSIVGAFIVAILASVAALVVVGSIVFSLANAIGFSTDGTINGVPAEESPMLIGIFVAAYAIFLFVMSLIPAAFQATLTNIVARGTRLDDHRLSANLNPFQFAWIALSNILLVVISFGLFLPWAVIRTHRYIAHHIVAKIAGDLDGYVSTIADETGAIGDEVGDAFDIDVGAI